MGFKGRYSVKRRRDVKMAELSFRHLRYRKLNPAASMISLYIEVASA
jgi:hypothetical protein